MLSHLLEGICVFPFQASWQSVTAPVRYSAVTAQLRLRNGCGIAYGFRYSSRHSCLIAPLQLGLQARYNSVAAPVATSVTAAVTHPLQL